MDLILVQETIAAGLSFSSLSSIAAAETMITAVTTTATMAAMVQTITTITAAADAIATATMIAAAHQCADQLCLKCYPEGNLGGSLCKKATSNETA